MVENLKIRRANSQDWISIFEIQQSPAFIYFTGHSFPPPQESVRERWEKRLSEPLVHTFVAELEDSKEVVGYVRLKQGEGKAAHVGEISIVAVHPDYQRKGVGLELMNSVINAAEDSLRLTRLRLTVHEDNKTAIHLYQRLGFKIEGRESKAIYKDGKYMSILIMGRIRCRARSS